MANKKISQLDPAQAMSPDDLLAIVQNINGLQTRKTTVGNLFSSYSGSCAVIETTYAQLKAQASRSQLIKGTYYLITDFQTIYTQPVSNVEKQGDIEPILLRAVSKNKLGVEAVSVSYPTDIIHYEITSNCEWNTENSKGQIIYRKDTKYNNECYYDFRNIKFARWFFNSTSFPDYNPNNVYYQRSVVKLNNSVYVAFGNNIYGISPEDDNGYKVWAKIYDNVSNLDYVLTVDTNIVGGYTDITGTTQLYRPSRRYIGEGLWSDSPNKLAGFNINSSGTMYECLTFSIPGYIQSPSDPMSHHFGVFSYNNSIGKALKEYPIPPSMYQNSYASITKHTLNNIVLWGSNDNTFGPDCFNNTLLFSFGNTFGRYCRGIVMTYSDACTLGGECYSTLITLSNSIDIKKRCGECAIHLSNSIKFGNDGYRNYTSQSKHINIGNGCTGTSCILSSDCQINGDSTQISFYLSESIEFGGKSCYLYSKLCTQIRVSDRTVNNTFELSSHLSFDYGNSSNNTISNSARITFGMYCSNNTIVDSSDITFGEYCLHNRVGDPFNKGKGVTGVVLDNHCMSNILEYCRSIKMESYGKNNTIKDSETVSLGLENKNNTIIYCSAISLLHKSMSNNLENCSNCTLEDETTTNYLAYCNRVKIGKKSTNNGSWTSDPDKGTMIDQRMYYCDDINIANDTHNNKMMYSYKIDLGHGSDRNTIINSSQINLGIRCTQNWIENSYDTTFEKECNNNTVKNSNANTFEIRCTQNWIENSYNTTLEKECNSNTIKDNSNANTFGIRCTQNWIENSYNTIFEEECNSNTIKNSNANTFGIRCTQNWIENSYQNTFGKFCSYNVLRNCSDNIFESRCHRFIFENCYDNYVEVHNTGLNNDYSYDTSVTPKAPIYQNSFKISKVRILSDTHPQLDLLGMNIDNNSFVAGTNQPKNRAFTDFKLLRSKVLGLLNITDTKQEIVNYKYYMTYRDGNLDIVKELLATTEVTIPGDSSNGWVDQQVLIYQFAILRKEMMA